MVANPGESHLGGVEGECHHPKARQEELTEVGKDRLAYHGVQWDNGGRHEGMEKVVYVLAENEPRRVHMLTHLQQSNSHPSARSFVRAPLCFDTSPTACPGGDAGISASSAPVTLPSVHGPWNYRSVWGSPTST